MDMYLIKEIIMSRLQTSSLQAETVSASMPHKSYFIQTWHLGLARTDENLSESSIYLHSL